MARLTDVQARAEAGEFATALTEPEWLDLSARARPKRLPRGAYLLVEGAHSDVVYVLVSGRVKVLSATSEGIESVLALRGPGTLLGELSAIDNAPRSASVVAIDPVETLVLTSRAFTEFLLAQPRVGLVLVRTLISRVREADRRRTEFGALDTTSRVALRLVELAERFGADKEATGQVRITVPITQDELASWVGASREAAVKALRLLRARGWIETERRGLVVRDLDALKRWTGLS
jgi:CRP/FNR family cyclic AMP-dependent transcriptional regulator